MISPRLRLPAGLMDLMGSSAFAAALSTTTIASVVFVHALRSTIGWPGYIAVLGGLVGLGSAALAVRHGDLEWHSVVPISLVLFIGWCTLSVFWSEYRWATVTGILYQLAVAFLAVFVALTRDLIQIVRAFGDVFRVLLFVSLALEVLSGLLLDLPIAFLDIQGNLAAGGPIQGLAGSRNMLGMLSVVAVVTFAIELVTRSVPRRLARMSLVTALLTLALTRSPVAIGIAVVVALAALGLAGIRRTSPERRALVQAVTLTSAFLAVAAGYIFRSRILDAVGATGELEVRFSLWRSVGGLMSLNPLEGFGWVGAWRPDLIPFLAISTINGRTPTSALNAYVDAWFQTGIVGLALFAVLSGLALVRAWLVAGTRRNVAHVWSALVLIGLALTATVESAVLVEYGWFLLVLCAMKSAQELSWRRGLR